MLWGEESHEEPNDGRVGFRMCRVLGEVGMKFGFRSGEIYNWHYRPALSSVDAGEITATKTEMSVDSHHEQIKWGESHHTTD